MFGKTSSSNNEVQIQAPMPSQGTCIARGVTLEGTLQAEGDIRIDGTFKGSMKTTGEVHIGAEATVIGPIEAQSADIAGTVNGSITAQKELVLLSTARITGDITTGGLSIEMGAALSGQVKAQRNET